MSIAAVVTRGYGTFGSIAEVVARGYFVAVEPLTPSPERTYKPSARPAYAPSG